MDGRSCNTGMSFLALLERACSVTFNCSRRRFLNTLEHTSAPTSGFSYFYRSALGSSRGLVNLSANNMFKSYCHCLPNPEQSQSASGIVLSSGPKLNKFSMQASVSTLTLQYLEPWTRWKQTPWMPEDHWPSMWQQLSFRSPYRYNPCIMTTQPNSEKPGNAFNSCSNYMTPENKEYNSRTSPTLFGPMNKYSKTVLLQ